LPRPSGRVHPGPERRDAAIAPGVRPVGLTAERPCGQRLGPLLRPGLPYYEPRYGQWRRRQRKWVRPASAATWDRLLTPARAQPLGGGRCGTQPGSGLRSEIPIRTGPWALNRPGYWEADRVAHGGGSLAGDFIWSLTCTDILSGWTEGGAGGHKGAAGVRAATGALEGRWPLAWLGFDSDHGGEFLNPPLGSSRRDRKEAVEFTRARPCPSDDHAPGEQQNGTWARQLLGYGRREDPALGALLGARDRAVWAPWQNFFLPGLKLERQGRAGRHWRKRYERPRTACERLWEPGRWSRQPRSRLKERHPSLDPFALKDELERRLGKIPSPATKTKSRPAGSVASPSGGARGRG
jgi:hypothetical protein